MKINSEAKLLAIMGLIVACGGGFLIFSNKNPVVPSPTINATPKPWNVSDFDVAFKAAKHVQGNPNAPLKVMEFADAQCPSCRRTHQNFGHKLGKEIEAQFAFMYYPIPNIGHERAIPCIIAMEAASRQNKFWEMHNALFAKQDSEAERGGEPDLSDAFIEKQASTIGLNIDQFKKDMKDPAMAKVAPDAVQYALSHQIDNTPTFVFSYKGKVEVAVGTDQFVEKLKGYPGMPTPEELKEKGTKPPIVPPSL